MTAVHLLAWAATKATNPVPLSPAARPSPQSSCSVLPGDTMAGIALGFRISLGRMVALNPQVQG